MIIGMLRVKNEERWIKRSISSILPICDVVLVMDDHSTDDTAAICRQFDKVAVCPSPFEGLDEARDKNWLLGHAMTMKPDWIIAIDGDEMLAPGSHARLRASMRAPHTCLSLRVLYLWDDENKVRMDGVYGDFHRESVFRPTDARFGVNSNGGHFHCGNVPWKNRQKRQVLSDVALLHFGYMHKEDRVRKYAFYNKQDPRNTREDYYRHMVIGDLFPAESRFLHGGPLQLKEIHV